MQVHEDFTPSPDLQTIFASHFPHPTIPKFGPVDSLLQPVGNLRSGTGLLPFQLREELVVNSRY